MKTISVDFTRNPKQQDFFKLAMSAAGGASDYRYLFFGGAIRGGKTFVALSIFAALAVRYPGSRWHIFRKDFPALESTTIPSFQKIIGQSPYWKWHRNRSNYHVEYLPTGSKIFFKGENICRDPDLNGLLGLETNGILYEQIEELSPKLWQMGCSRLGSWYIDDMPVPITLATFNPTQKWIKQMIYEPYIREELAAPYYYLAALPTDNAFVTKEQWSAWEHLDERYQLQYIQGDWTDHMDKDNLWAYAFDKEKHVSMPEIDEKTLYLSFDFNRNPICCSAIQFDDTQIRVLETIKLHNTDIFALCDVIQSKYPKSTYMVTGDASGSNSSALVRDGFNFFTAIRGKLHLSSNQFKLPNSNPPLAENQVLINALLYRHDVQIHAEKAKGLIYDLEHVRREADGSIVKRDRRDPSQQADALDTFRYFCNAFMHDFVHKQDMDRVVP